MHNFETSLTSPSENKHAFEVFGIKLTSFKYAFLNSFTQIAKRK